MENIPLRICPMFVLCDYTPCLYYKPIRLKEVRFVYCLLPRGERQGYTVEVAKTVEVVKEEYVKYMRGDPQLIELVEVDEE